ncbi:MAG TPA: hypothetical protein VGO90_11795 [Chthoniobacteraceae bacterium]|jgi:hypothetical protein|nr:hypothetical protein [Chthoniobacter sp.]HEV7868357.1 hypothetical protein [Chthoniobacteraceae bacterium]
MAEELKAELLGTLSSARAHLSAEGGALKTVLSPKRMLRDSIDRNRSTLLGSCALGGMLLAWLPGRRKEKVVRPPSKRSPDVEKAGRAAIVLAVLKFATDLTRPILLEWVQKRAGRR